MVLIFFKKSLHGILIAFRRHKVWLSHAQLEKNQLYL